MGTNLGGLGTLIASLASLISFKLYAALPEAKPGRYLAVFTAVNLAGLAILGSPVFPTVSAYINPPVRSRTGGFLSI